MSHREACTPLKYDGGLYGTWIVLGFHPLAQTNEALCEDPDPYNHFGPL